MRKYCEENERMKWKYAVHLRNTKGRDIKSLDKIAAALVKFEQSTKCKLLKKFHIDQAVKFKAYLNKAKNPSNGNLLSFSTIDATLRLVKGFFQWLADQPGYKSRISFADVEYFNNTAKHARIAHAKRDIPFPTMEQAKHAFLAMPNITEIERRNKALFAFLMLTGARDGAIASLRLKHINLLEKSVDQGARDVNTKNSKSFRTWFFPVDPEYLECFVAWMNYLKSKKLYGPQDALFPKPARELINGLFNYESLSRVPYTNSSKINSVIREAFTAVNLPEFTPHNFRKTLAFFWDQICTNMEQRKAWSMNLGHEHMGTTISAYMPVSQQWQGELIKGLGEKTSPCNT